MFLGIRARQIKATMRYHFTPTSNGYRQIDNNKHCQGYGKSEPSSIVCGTVKCCDYCEKTVWQSLKKLSTELPLWPTILLLAPKKLKIRIQTEIGTQIFITALFVMGKW